MGALKQQFITDNEGKNIAVLLPIKEYNKLMAELEGVTSKETELSDELKAALDESLKGVEEGRVTPHAEVMEETKKRYPNLFK